MRTPRLISLAPGPISKCAVVDPSLCRSKMFAPCSVECCTLRCPAATQRQHKGVRTRLLVDLNSLLPSSAQTSNATTLIELTPTGDPAVPRCSGDRRAEHILVKDRQLPAGYARKERTLNPITISEKMNAGAVRLISCGRGVELRVSVMPIAAPRRLLLVLAKSAPTRPPPITALAPGEPTLSRSSRLPRIPAAQIRGLP